ncbi:SufD family Fe-S cluster assembly protein [Hydrogenimonas urashimensis]|uniref:SufD family Fe-S cluster assembly protein n=1 Tax=Hydrogenimonas urashimensis TaxID=2740515 RepID=UPI001914FCE7|nr:SufD family Fe-S cluster assembly protein [Hydrogenimonas urashimensis]
MRPLDLSSLDAGAILQSCGAPKGREKAAQCLAKLGIPTKKSEAYRYFDPRPLIEREWERVVNSQVKPERANALVICDGVVTEVPGSDAVEVEITGGGAVDAGHFDPLYYLGHLLALRTVVVRFKRDAKVRIVHRFSEPQKLLAYRLEVRLEPHANVQVEERFEGDAPGAFVLQGWDLVIGDYAALKWIGQQTLLKESHTPVFSHDVQIGRGGYLGLHTFDYGAGRGLQPLKVTLAKDAEARAFHLIYAEGGAQRGIVSQIVHEGSYSLSTQRAKTILGDEARGIFDALIKVDSGGKYAKAHQNSKAILLSDGAYMAAKPQLEIYIDELEASHGATTGQLDPEQLFYLRARGIAEAEARKMLILAFANEMIDLIEDENLRNRLYGEFEKVYYGESHVTCLETCHGCQENLMKEENHG